MLGKGSGISLKRALFWMNNYRELLEVDERALRRIRAFKGSVSGWHEAEVLLMVIEIQRVSDRLSYWEEAVDGANWGLLQPA
jgi:hypothetical protein